jgi:hypothetical protein
MKKFLFLITMLCGFNLYSQTIDQAVLIGGLTYGESLEKQVSRLSSSLGVPVKGFSHSESITTIKEYLQKNKNVPIFLFSAGCKLSSQLSSLPYVDKNRFYIIEPYHSGGNVTKSVRKSISDGVPECNVFVGPNPERGFGIVKGSLSSNTKCHYCSITTVGNILRY